MDNGDNIRRLSKQRVESTLLLYSLRERLKKALAAADMETQGTIPYICRGLASVESQVARLTRGIDLAHRSSQAQQQFLDNCHVHVATTGVPEADDQDTGAHAEA